MLMKQPKMPSAPVMETNQALDQREARADASEKKQLAKTAARRRALRRGSGLVFQDRENPMLGVPTTLQPEQNFRDPYGMTTQRGPGV